MNPQQFRERYKNHLINAWEKYGSMYNSMGSQAAGADGLGYWWRGADLGTSHV